MRRLLSATSDGQDGRRARPRRRRCSGKQVAILAPTSVLAEQYQAAVAPLVRATGARAVSLGPGQTAAERRAALADVASGDAQVVVGTHALLSDKVVFADLGLVVVDEQHRLGVAQRLALVKKASGPARTKGPAKGRAKASAGGKARGKPRRGPTSSRLGDADPRTWRSARGELATIEPPSAQQPAGRSCPGRRPARRSSPT